MSSTQVVSSAVEQVLVELSDAGATGCLTVTDPAGEQAEVFFKDGRRELYNLQVDLSETRNVSADNPKISEHLTRAMQSYIDRGRSTRGGEQKNDAALSLEAKTSKKKKASKKQS